MVTNKVDKTDPICGMKGTIFAHDHYFCSEYCIRKYEEQNKIPQEKKFCPSCEIKVGTPWYKERLYIITIITLILLIISYFVSIMNPFFYAFIDYLKLSLRTITEQLKNKF